MEVELFVCLLLFFYSECECINYNSSSVVPFSRRERLMRKLLSNALAMPRFYGSQLIHNSLSIKLKLDCYRPQRNWGKAIFSEACQEFCPQGGGRAWLLGGHAW